MLNVKKILKLFLINYIVPILILIVKISLIINVNHVKVDSLKIQLDYVKKLFKSILLHQNQLIINLQFHRINSIKQTNQILVIQIALNLIKINVYNVQTDTTLVHKISVFQ